MTYPPITAEPTGELAPSDAEPTHPAAYQRYHNAVGLGLQWALEAYNIRRREARRRALRRPPHLAPPMYPPDQPMLGPRIVFGVPMGRLRWLVDTHTPAVIDDLPLPHRR